MLTEDMERELEKAVEVLESGGVVVYPTETAVSYTHLTLPTILLV